MDINNLKVFNSEIGETIFAPTYPQKSEGTPELDVINGAGWHNVNSLYRYDRPNGINDFLLIFTISGKGVAYIENQNFELSSDSVFIIPPKLSSGYHTQDKHWEFYWIHIDGKNAENILNFLMNDGKYLLDIARSGVKKYIKQILNPVCALSERYLYAAKLISKILFEIIYTTNPKPINDAGIIEELISYLEQENTTVNLNEFAARHYRCVPVLIRDFSKKTGETPYSYHRTYKMQKAAQRLIYTKMQIKTIALTAGYSSESAFSTQFLKLYGLPPSEYRKRYKVYQN